MPPKAQQTGDGSFVISDFPMAGLQQLFGQLAGFPGSIRIGRPQQQRPAVEHRGVGHIFQGEMNPRAWIDREQRRGQSPSNNNNNRNNTTAGNNNNASSSSSSTSRPINQPQSATELRDRGNQAFREGHLQEALSLYTAALNLNPACETALTNRATTHFKLKNYEAAAADARRAIQIKPDYFKAHYRLGMSLSQLGYYEEAIEALKSGETLTQDEDTKQDIAIQIAKAESKLKTRNAAQEDATEKMIQQVQQQQQRQFNVSGGGAGQSSVAGSTTSIASNLGSNFPPYRMPESPSYANSFAPITPLGRNQGFPADAALPAGLTNSSTSGASPTTSPGLQHLQPNTDNNNNNTNNNTSRTVNNNNNQQTHHHSAVNLDNVAQLAKEAISWRGLDDDDDDGDDNNNSNNGGAAATFVNESLVEALGLLSSKSTSEHQKHILQECNPESLQNTLDEYNRAQTELRAAAKESTNREKFHKALRNRDEKLQTALKAAAKTRVAIQKLHELRSRNDACRTVIDQQLQFHEKNRHHHNNNKKKSSGSENTTTTTNDDSESASSPPQVIIEDVPQLIQEYKKLKSELAGEVQSAMNKTDKAAIEFLNCLKEEQRILQDTGRDRSYFKPLRTISTRIIHAARQKVQDRSPLLESDRVREIDSLVRHAEADRASLQRASFEGQKLLDTESALERDRLNFERQRIQLQAEFDWLLVKEEDDERKLQSLRRNIERVKEQSSAVSRKQHDIQQRILRLIETDLPELAWKAAAGGKKILKWAKGSGTWINMSLSDFDIVRTLASTPSSKVLQARSKRDGLLVAIKEVQVEDVALRRRFQNEVNIVSGLAPHRNVVQLHGVFFDGPFAYIVMPFFELGSILEWIKKGVKKSPLKEWRLQEFLRQIVSGLASLHDQGVLHNDVKLNNMLMGPDYTPVLADFGLARDVGRFSEKADVTYDATNFQGTESYAAPELLNPPNITSLIESDYGHNNSHNNNSIYKSIANNNNYNNVDDDDKDLQSRNDSTTSTSLTTFKNNHHNNNNNSHHHTSSSKSDSAALLASPTTLAMSTGKPTMRSDIFSLGISLLQIAVANHKALTEEKEEQARKKQKEKEEREQRENNNGNTEGISTTRNEDGSTSINIDSNARPQRRSQQDDDDNGDSIVHREIRQTVHADAAENSSSAAPAAASAPAADSTSIAGNNDNTNSSTTQQPQPQQQRGSDLSRALIVHPSTELQFSSASLTDFDFSGSSPDAVATSSPNGSAFLPQAAAGKTVDPKVVGNDRLADLLTEMIAIDPSSRPSAQEILAHPYFSISLLEESVKSNQLDESNSKLEALFSHIHALRAMRRNPVLVSVERNQMVESVSAIVAQMKDEALLNPLFVVFRGEEGLDEGGLTGELIQMYFMQAITNHRMLTASSSATAGSSQSSCNIEEGGDPTALSSSPSPTASMTREETQPPHASSADENSNSSNNNNNNNNNSSNNDDDATKNNTSNSNNNTAPSPSDDLPLTGGTGRVLASDPIVMLDTPYLPSDDRSIPPGLFETMGRMLLKALIENRPIPILLSSVVFKYIVGLKPNMLDLEEYDQSLWRSLRQFQYLSAEDFEAAMMSFDEFPAAMLTKDLQFEASICNEDVTPENVKKYITAKAYHTLVYSRKNALDAIKKGFFACELLQHHLQLMSPIELQIALCGHQHVTAQDVIALLDFVNFPSDSKTPTHFVEAITNMSQNNIRRFLRLTTSSVTIPRGGQGRSARIRIVCTHDEERLPVGHTCVNQMDLPNYNDKAKMNKMLAMALAHAEDGFFVM